ncbi:MAG: NIL domain-containing protein [Spirochaetota bacterium]
MTSKKLLLQISRHAASQPLIYYLAKDYDLMVNIYRAKITPDDTGYMVVDITGKSENIQKAMVFFEQNNIVIDENMKALQWDEKSCVSCGACIVHCPTGALHVTDRSTMSVTFEDSKCIDCMNCIDHCPFDACSSIFEDA